MERVWVYKGVCAYGVFDPLFCGFLGFPHGFLGCSFLSQKPCREFSASMVSRGGIETVLRWASILDDGDRWL